MIMTWGFSRERYKEGSPILLSRAHVKERLGPFVGCPFVAALVHTILLSPVIMAQAWDAHLRTKVG